MTKIDVMQMMTTYILILLLEAHINTYKMC